MNEASWHLRLNCRFYLLFLWSLSCLCYHVLMELNTIIVLLLNITSMRQLSFHAQNCVILQRYTRKMLILFSRINVCTINFMVPRIHTISSRDDTWIHRYLAGELFVVQIAHAAMDFIFPFDTSIPWCSVTIRSSYKVNHIYYINSYLSDGYLKMRHCLICSTLLQITWPNQRPLGKAR